MYLVNATLSGFQQYCKSRPDVHIYPPLGRLEGRTENGRLDGGQG